MGDELVELFEGAFVEEQFDALAGGELALFMLAIAAFFAAALLGRGMAAVELLESVHGLIVAGRALLAVDGGWWLVAGGWWFGAFGLDWAFLCTGAEWGAKWLFVRTKPISAFESVDLRNSEPNLAAGSVGNLGAALGGDWTGEIAVSGAMAVRLGLARMCINLVVDWRRTPVGGCGDLLTQL
jgi:hypothetical protein